MYYTDNSSRCQSSLDGVSSRDMSLVEIHSVYLYMRYKNCVGLRTFRRPRGLTDCASYDTLAKLTTPRRLLQA